MCEQCTHRIAIYETRWIQVNALESVPEVGELLALSARMSLSFTAGYGGLLGEGGYLWQVVPTTEVLDRWCDQQKRRLLLPLPNGQQLPLWLTDHVPQINFPEAAKIQPRRREAVEQLADGKLTFAKIRRLCQVSKSTVPRSNVAAVGWRQRFVAWWRRARPFWKPPTKESQ